MGLFIFSDITPQSVEDVVQGGAVLSSLLLFLLAFVLQFLLWLPNLLLSY